MKIYLELSNHENDTFHLSKTRNNQYMEFVNRLYNDDIYINIIPIIQYFENRLVYQDNVLSSMAMQRLLYSTGY